MFLACFLPIPCVFPAAEIQLYTLQFLRWTCPTIGLIVLQVPPQNMMLKRLHRSGPGGSGYGTGPFLGVRATGLTQTSGPSCLLGRTQGEGTPRKVTRMTVKTSYRTVIVCDGSGGDCPNAAVLDICQAPNAALRRAVKTGWLVNDEHLCPECREASYPAPTPLIRRVADHPVLDGPAATVHQLSTRRVTGAAPSTPDLPYVCYQMSA